MNNVIYVTLGELRTLIRESLAGSHPSEAYSKDLEDDPALKKKSVYVPDDIKKAISKWSKDMGMTSKGKHKRSKK